MRQSIKKFLCVVIFASGLEASWAYSLLGPIGNGGDAWQVPTIGYDYPGSGDIGSPKNVGEEYRRNTPVMYYTFDRNFLDYFGSNGVVAVEQAFAIMNTVTNVDHYSSALTEFPLNSQVVNYQAMALGLYDLKSETLSVLAEQMGLAEPERYTWTLHDRYLPPGGTCPESELYLVVQRNFDITTTPLTPLNQVQYSPYVNGTLYSYIIDEFCTGPDPLAITVPFNVDSDANLFTAVAGRTFGLEFGGFYNGLTRDDVAGLRYLLSTNNVNTESSATGAYLTIATTNFSAQNLFPANTNGAFGGFGTFNLSTLLLAASTNDPVTLVALFPGLVVASSTTNYVIAQGSTVISYFTNQIGAPIGSPPLLVVVTNHYSYPLTIYTDTFANVVTNHYSSSTIALLQTSSLGRLVGAPLGSPLVTNTTITYLNVTLPNGANLPSGDYYLLPTNLCGVDIISTFFSTNVTVTNNITAANTNFSGTNLFYTQDIISSYNSSTYLIHPVTCLETTDSTSLYQGIGGVRFVRADFDSLFGQYFNPITNDYTMVSITNSKASVQHFKRVVTVPDFLLSAADLAGGPNDPPGTPVLARGINFNESNVYQNLAGPGTIDPFTAIIYDKVGTVYLNGPIGLNTNAFLSEITQSQLLAWGSFDGSTNDPVVYPNGASIANLANQILIQILPASLPNGTKGTSYPITTFTVTGGAFSPPFTWTLAAGLGSLPPGLTLSSGGTISGTPTHSGTYDFVLQLNDSLTPPRTVQWNYSITIP